jgi:murein DD-endopeptidase MepM/ murein hydrolase activator NlpD
MALVFSCCVLASRAENSADGVLNIFTQDENGSRRFYVQNLQSGTVTATFDARLRDMTASVTFPKTVTVGGKQTAEIFILTPSSANWHYNYNFACNFGSTTAVHDDSQIYELPYEPGTAHAVVQGHHGKFSHTGEDEYAVDWKMPEGTSVCAARDGIVVKTKGDSSTGGPDRKYEKLANCVFVQHSDGTIGVYLHLQKGGCKVKVGDTVKAGDVIGLSGNTGFSSGPHLHFAVFKLKSGSERVSIPVKFRTTDSDAVIPETGHAYMAALKPSQPTATVERRATRPGS